MFRHLLLALQLIEKFASLVEGHIGFGGISIGWYDHAWGTFMGKGGWGWGDCISLELDIFKPDSNRYNFRYVIKKTNLNCQTDRLSN